ncbi:hypothetical protein M3685_13390 [Heyndrickxia oleronia]|uniref:ATP-dependent DNA ligase family profile domain-containing protein n=2 Tax=Heyndrickxia oleronia TaxID=38875 RepID=A0AAW6SWV1_9BACI|nr:hypothetical protein [Heyndrickxia oleronia]MCM3454916.1 hypothetical protein [Heyndrickxia oleronia]MDH5163344.1 hypothetical protein [Heyndrickxia oleronia]NYV66527.1 hypothetical protein [Bacillus sp. Gen3]GIN41557.1 SPBc2 prophage-derived DNA ligase-like protein LigB [Heyndrickxia oleronia]
MYQSPMLLHKIDEPFADSNDQYLVELKADGIRLIVSKWNNSLRFYTRHNNDVTYRFAKYFLDLEIPDGTIIDTEIIVTDDKGKPDFEKVLHVFQSNNSEYQPVLFAFDILYYNYKKLTSLHILKRKEILQDILPKSQKITSVKYMIGNGTSYFKAIKENDLEGIVFKDIEKDTKYHINKRSFSWLKLINYKYTNCYILGSRKQEFGWLLGIEEANDIRPVGVMEFVPPAARKKIYQIQDKLKIRENEKYIYFEPKIKCEIKFRNFTSNNLLRIPSFIKFL